MQKQVQNEMSLAPKVSGCLKMNLAYNSGSLKINLQGTIKMKQSSVTLRVENFRAIGKAEIKLDGITVVAGVNGCGKSTLSKLLYWVYKGATEYTILKLNYLHNTEFDTIETLITILTSRIGTPSTLLPKCSKEDYQLAQRIHTTNMQEWSKIIDKSSQDELLEFLDNLEKQTKEILHISQIFHKYSNIHIIFEKEFSENKPILEQLKNEFLTKDWLFFIQILRQAIFQYFNLEQTVSQKKLVETHIKEAFHTKNLPKKLEILENDEIIFSELKETMYPPYWIDNVVYIDTPVAFNHCEEEHWKDLNKKLKQLPKLNEKTKHIQEIDDLIKHQIFKNGAEVKFDELSESFTFRTSSGVEMDLSDSATGMKSFAVLDRLVKNGSINSKTLLILDEPEAHLHPQWVVEFGRLLTLINKHIGAKIFVATHSPDMVQALRYIPNKESIGERVNFYLAEDNSETHLFDYQDLEGKVGKIFTSFNKSLDKLEQYGEE